MLSEINIFLIHSLIATGISHLETKHMPATAYILLPEVKRHAPVLAAVAEEHELAVYCTPEGFYRCLSLADEAHNKAEFDVVVPK